MMRVSLAALLLPVFASCANMRGAEPPNESLQRHEVTLRYGRSHLSSDMRPFDRHKQSLDDLKLMLQERETFYSQADHQIDTSTISAEAATEKLCGIIQEVAEAS